MNSVRKLAIVTTMATYLLISVGGFVRASGSGLGCPDWPQCFGRWIPPTSVEQLPDDAELRAQFNFAKAWTEYVNRLVGVVIGLLILATTVLAWKKVQTLPRRVPWTVTAALLLTMFQGWFGGQVVKYELDPRFVSVHLVVAVVIVSLLLLACVDSWRGTPLPTLPAGRLRLRRATAVLLLISLVQLLLGAWVRGEIDVAAKADPSMGRDAWLGDVGLADWLHRKVALLLIAVLVWVTWVGRNAARGERILHLTRWFNVAVVAGQVVAGLALAYAGMPAWAQVVHLSLGTWLLGGLTLQWLLCGRAVDGLHGPSLAAAGSPS